MITFSKNIIENFTQNHTEFLLQIEKKGCDGNTILLQDFPEEFREKPEYKNISHNLGEQKILWIHKDFLEKLDGGFVTHTGTKFIFSHPESILTRCGCGRSFSFKSGNHTQDKIAILKAKLRKKPAHH